MRIVLMILMLVGLIATVGLGVVTAHNNLFSEGAERAEEAAESVASAAREATEAGQLRGVLEGLSGLTQAGYAGILLPALALLVVVFVFFKRGSVLLLLLAISIAAAAFFVWLSPSVDPEKLGADPGRQSQILAIGVVVTALCGFGAEYLRRTGRPG